MLRSDPIDLLVNALTNDVVITTDLALTSGVAGVMQAVRIRLATIAGEWFLDLDLGIPLFERVGVSTARAIFGQKFDQTKAANEFRKAILSTPGIVSVTSLEVTFDGKTRAMTVIWGAQTAFGDTPVDTLTLGA
jgi:hypothetical protein